MTAKINKTLGFWRCWALVVGSMIGNGIFMLPAVMAPYGSNALFGFVFAGLGTILLALTMGAIAKRIPKIGGPYAYTNESLQHLGEIPCFMVAWGYWMAFWLTTTAGAIAFVGYLGFFYPSIATDPIWGAIIAITVIWLFTAINVSGVRNGGVIQLVTTILKLLPLFLIAGSGLFFGNVTEIPARNPENESFTVLISTLVLITMWAYVGFENASVAAEDIIEPEKNIPRTMILGTIMATLIYIVATFGIMALVPVDELADSSSPFADAAAVLFGNWGASLVAIGAIISIIGAMNGNILATGQLARAISMDRFLPPKMGELNTNNSPATGLIVSGILSTILVVMNFHKGLIGAYTVIILMSTMMAFIAYCGSTITSLYFLKKDHNAGKGMNIKILVISLLALLFTIFAMVGSGLEAAIYSGIYLLLGLPVYYWIKYKYH